MYLIILVKRADILADLVDKLFEDRMFVISTQLIEKFLYCHGMIAQVLHVYLPLEFIYQVQGRCWHTKLADPIHVLALLKHTLVRSKATLT